eukprot:TRINITY_DN12825_c0_g2_i1.p1 TRINITY_DN12825_c0_g2~~TRINITY_DN12825_c0_g2_i1.p1  ORF type:complete len:204 (+),score=23.97 TRINITY_DN12825_c0_g2_i1:62-673(+)
MFKRLRSNLEIERITWRNPQFYDWTLTWEGDQPSSTTTWKVHRNVLVGGTRAALFFVGATPTPSYLVNTYLFDFTSLPHAMPFARVALAVLLILQASQASRSLTRGHAGSVMDMEASTPKASVDVAATLADDEDIFQRVPTLQDLVTMTSTHYGIAIIVCTLVLSLVLSLVILAWFSARLPPKPLATKSMRNDALIAGREPVS